MQNDDPQVLRYLVELQDRLAEDEMYEDVLLEINNGDFDAVAQARAFEEAGGNAEQARSIYIRHRIRRLKDHLMTEAIRQRQEEMERQRQPGKKPFSLEEHEEELRQHEQRKRKLHEL